MSLFDRLGRNAPTQSPFQCLLDEVLADTLPEHELSDDQLSGYLEVVLRRGMREVVESRDDLSNVRADLRDGTRWSELRKRVDGIMHWVYEERGPASLATMAGEAKAPMLATLAYM